MYEKNEVSLILEFVGMWAMMTVVVTFGIIKFIIAIADNTNILYAVMDALNPFMSTVTVFLFAYSAIRKLRKRNRELEAQILPEDK